MKYSWGTYMWTASAAGWFVLGMVGAGEICWLVSAGCASIAYLWKITFEENTNEND